MTKEQFDFIDFEISVIEQKIVGMTNELEYQKTRLKALLAIRGQLESAANQLEAANIPIQLPPPEKQ